MDALRFPLSNAFGVNMFLDPTQGALRDPGLWGETPSAYVLGSLYEPNIQYEVRTTTMRQLFMRQP